MPRTYQPRPKKTYTEITEENALAEHKEFGTSVRALAEKPKLGFGGTWICSFHQ